VIAYLDASALVKRYVAEPGAPEVARLVAEARAAGTSVLSRVEVESAFAKGVRAGLLARETALACSGSFRRDWPDLVRLPAGEPLLARAAALAWQHELRAADAVHLATALAWREALDAPLTFAAFDPRLAAAAAREGLATLP
jgi:predicted nucleic acid-binding protein